MNKIFKALVFVASLAGLQLAGTMAANASQTGLLQYAQDPTGKEVTKFEPIKVASRRSRRRNRIIGGVVAAGVAAVIINRATRSNRRRYRSRSRYYYPGRRQCRKWAVRCDYGNYRACRSWNRRCR